MSKLSLGNPADGRPADRGLEVKVESARVITGATGPGEVRLKLLGGVRLIGAGDIWLRLVGDRPAGVGIAAKVTLRCSPFFDALLPDRERPPSLEKSLDAAED